MHGETLVLDEVQWAEDEERGSAWTRLMLGGEYRHILLLGAVEALPLVEEAFPRRRGAVLRAQVAARLDRQARNRRAEARHRHRRVQRRAVIGARGRAQPAPPRQGRRALRRDAARVASRGDRPLPLRRGRGVRRDRRARARRQPAVRDAALRGDRQVRRQASGATSSRGRSRRSRDAPAASASTSAATSVCSPVCRGRIPIPSSCSRR